MKRIFIRFNENHIIRTFVVIAIIVLSFKANAQFGFHKGYVITSANDTIQGLISDNGDIGNSAVCKFKSSEKGKVTHYLPGEIKSYRFIDGKYYTSLQISDKKKEKMAFVEVLLDDKVSLYKYWKNEDFRFFLRKENGSIVILSYEGVFFKNDNNPYLTPKIYIAAYKDTLDSVFEKCNELKPKIEELEYSSKDLINITKEYVDCVYKANNRDRYEKNFSKTKLSAGFFAGVQMSKINILESDITSNYINSFPYGIFLNLPFPLINERISFQTELLTNRLDYNNGFNNIPSLYTDISISSSQISMPLMIKYSFLNKKFSPSIGIGKELTFLYNTKAKTTPVSYDFENLGSKEQFEYRQEGFLLHFSQRDSWFVDLGIDYKINSKFSIFSNLRLQKNLNLIIEEEYYNNYLFNVAAKKNQLNNPHSNLYRTYSGTLFLGIRF